MPVPYLRFSGKFRDGYGCLIIEGLDTSISFLSLFFAQFKKEIKKDYDVGVTATFVEFPEEGEIKCMFLENGAYAERHNITPRIHARRFEETFPMWVGLFEEVLEDIAFRLENGNTEEEIFQYYYPEAYKRRLKEEKKAEKKAKKGNN